MSNAVRGDSGADITWKPRQIPCLQKRVKRPGVKFACLWLTFLHPESFTLLS